MFIKFIFEVLASALVVWMYLNQDKLIRVERLVFSRRGRALLKENFKKEFNL